MENKRSKNILFTFDYELFLGSKSGTVDDCLIYPTQKIMESLRPYGARAIFFIDATYLIRLEKEDILSARSDFHKISEQIRILISENHYVFPHFHPHWADAKYHPKINQWSLNDLRKYRFHNISDFERNEMFESAINILTKIIKTVNPSYKLNGYRAGGWSIQPFDDFYPFFKKYGIKYDFSVLPGEKLFSNAQHYDFTSVPPKSIYRFSQDITVEDVNGEMTEFTISKININWIQRILNQFFLKMHPFITAKIGDGLSVKVVSDNLASSEMLGIELLTTIKYPIYLEYINKNSFIHFISHPKMMTYNGFIQFNKLIQQTFTSYEVETDFQKMI